MSANVFEKYTIDHTKRFGEGGYGAAFAATDTKTGEAVVVKVIDTRKMHKDQIKKECLFMEAVSGHPNVIKLLDHSIGQGKHAHLYFIYMERASGGELFDQLTNHNGAVPEAAALEWMRQMCAGVAHCHSRGVAHRDIKLENVLLNEQKEVKVIDFGLAHQYELDASTGAVRRSLITGLCGSKSYAAPEVLQNGRAPGYDGFQADVWSLGVSFFGLLNGFFPLEEAKQSDWRFQKLMQAQQRGQSSVHTILGWYKKRPTHLSDKAVRLLDAMLNIDPTKRPSIQDVLADPLFTGEAAVNIDYDDMGDSLHYRGAGAGAYNFGGGVADDMEIMDDAPVYRSLAGGFDDDEGDVPEMPGISRQAAFGGAETLGDLFVP